MKESNEGADVAILVSPWLPVWLTVPSMLFVLYIICAASRKVSQTRWYQFTA